MSDDSRDAQSKYDRPAATSGLPRPAAPPVAPPAATPAVPPPAVPPAARPPAPPAAARPAARVAASAPPLSSAATAPDEDADADFDEEDVSPSLADRLRRLSPALVTLGVGSLGSLIFLAMAVTSHTTPVPILLGAGVVTGLVFGLDSVIASVATYRAAEDGETGRAVLLALAGGICAVVCAAALAGSLIMVLALNG